MSTYYDHYWQINKGAKLGDYSYKLPIIQKFLPINKENLTILDYGCGKGTFTQLIKDLNPHSKVIGADVSILAIAKAKKSHKAISFYPVVDGGKIPMKDRSVDYILTSDVIEHVYNTEILIKEFYRVLKPGGKILITTPYHGLIKNLIIVFTAFDLIFDPTGAHIRFFTKKSLQTLVEKSKLKVLKIGYFGRFYPISRAMYLLAQKDNHANK